MTLKKKLPDQRPDRTFYKVHTNPFTHKQRQLCKISKVTRDRLLVITNLDKGKTRRPINKIGNNFVPIISDFDDIKKIKKELKTIKNLRVTPRKIKYIYNY